MYSQHDGAPLHYTWHVRDYLQIFPELLVRSWWTRCMATKVARSYSSRLLSLGHMKTLVYETKVDSRAALRHCIFVPAEHIHNHPDNFASAAQSLLMCAENCISAVGHFEQLL